MKIFLVGASGYIGIPLARALASLGDVVGTSTAGGPGLMALDLRLADQGDLLAIDQGDVVVLTAAISSPDVCRNEPELARRVNVTGARELLSVAVQRGARVIFFSSDTVYGECLDPVDESTPCNPVGDYAGMKHELERSFEGCRAFKALRLSYVFSREDKFTRYLEGTAAKGGVAEVFDPFDRAVVHRDDVVDCVVGLIARWDAIAEPVINLGGPDLISRRAYAELVRDHALTGLRYTVVTPPPAFFDSRARVINMKSPVLQSVLGRPPTPFAEAIRREFETLELK